MSENRMFTDESLWVIANGVEEGGKVDQGIAWCEQMLRDVQITLTPSTAFEYENIDRMTHQLFVDFTGTTATSYEAGFPQVVFETTDDLIALRDELRTR